MLKITRPHIFMGAAVLTILGAVSWHQLESGAAAGVVVASVRMAPLASDWSATGYVECRTSQVAAARVGTVAEVLVTEGARVHAGQILARLVDQTETAGARAQEKGVEVAEAQAEAAAASVREQDGAQPSRVARAEAEARAANAQVVEFDRVQKDRVEEARASLAAARARYEQSQSALTRNADVAAANLAAGKSEQLTAEAQLRDLQNGARPEEIEQAQAAVASAQAAVTRTQSEQERQTMLLQGRAVGRRAVEDADEALAQAEAALKRSRAALELLRHGSRPQQVKAASAAVQTAQEHVRLAEAQQRGLDTDKGAVQEARAGVNAAEAALEEAQSALRQRDSLELKARAAEAAVQETRAGTRKGATLRSEERAARARVGQDQALAHQSRSQLSELTIRAPFDGIVGRRLVDPGNVANPNQPLFSVVETSRAWVAAEVDTQDVGKVKTGQPVTITAPAYPGRSFDGRVEAVGSEAIPQTEIRTGARIVRCRISLAATPMKDRLLLKPGMDVDVSGRTGMVARTLLVPADALLSEPAGSYVFVLQSGYARKRRVRTGYSSGKDTEILSGVQNGEQVIVVGKDGLADGSRVRPRETP